MSLAGLCRAGAEDAGRAFLVLVLRFVHAAADDTARGKQDVNGLGAHVVVQVVG